MFIGKVMDGVAKANLLLDCGFKFKSEEELTENLQKLVRKEVQVPKLTMLEAALLLVYLAYALSEMVDVREMNKKEIH